MRLKTHSIPLHDILFIVALGIFLIVSLITLTSYPPVWPDEPLYQNVALNLLKGNGFKIDLWQELIPTFDHGFFAYPPGIFVTLAIWFKLAGHSIIAQRLLSLLASCLFLILLYLFSKSFFAKNRQYFALIPIILILTNNPFWQASHLSRPEIFVSLLGLGAVWLAKKLLEEKLTAKKEKRLLMLSGLLCGLSAVFHLTGILFAISIFTALMVGQKPFKNRLQTSTVFLAGFLLPIAIWLGLMWKNISAIISQLVGINTTRGVMMPDIIKLIQNDPIEYKIYILMLIILFYFAIINAYAYKKPASQLLVSVIMWAFFIGMTLRSSWYGIYLFPYIFLAFSQTFDHAHVNWKKSLLSVLLLLALADQAYILKNNLSQAFQEKNSYSYLSSRILEIIPDNTTVFLSSIPDLYYAFNKAERRNTLYEFPAVEADQADYTNILSKADYVVYNGVYTLFEPNLLPNYLSQNTNKIISIKTQNMELLVFELKPKKERKSS